jgi:DNA-binding transcriptional ArsR family regulator
MPNASAARSDVATDSGDAAAVRRRATLQEARALAHPLRLRILRLCLDQARTNSELAAALGERPATTLYHVRTLLRNDFLAEQPSRPGPRGTVEKPYRATGKSARLDGSLSDDATMLRAIFEAVAAEVDEAGPDAIVEANRMALRLRPGELAELRAQVQALLAQVPSIDEYLAAESEPEADPYALLLVLHKRAS